MPSRKGRKRLQVDIPEKSITWLNSLPLPQWSYIQAALIEFRKLDPRKQTELAMDCLLTKEEV
jgi:hypothetical protein